MKQHSEPIESKNNFLESKKNFVESKKNFIESKKNSLYFTDEVLQILQVSNATLYRLRKELGYTTTCKKPKKRYTLKEVEELLDLIVRKNE